MQSNSPVQRVRDYFEPRWNSLIPKRAIETAIVEGVGVRYLHATKGWKYISAKRFFIRGLQ